MLRIWNSLCAVSGSSTLDAIRASHIKPWRDSTDHERLDPANGLPLLANYDALFDAGLISFDDNGCMIVSSILNVTEREQLDVIGKRLQLLCRSTMQYRVSQ
ncbi:MAG: HNH endonuclease [bacterium]|nr:HNH endonuclease [bacterium]